MNEPRQSPHDDEMLTPIQRRTMGNWSDGIVKAVALIGGLFGIIAGAWIAFGTPGGGIRFGNQVETEALAKTTQTQNEAVIKRLDGVDTTLKEMNKNLAQVPLMSQTLAQHGEHLNSLDNRLDALVKQLGEDENKSAALIPGWYSIYASPQVRQPPGRRQ